MGIFAIILTVLAIGWGMLEAGMQFNKILLSGRFGMMAVVMTLFFAFMAFIMTGGYVFTEFVINKGPNDWGSMWHVGYPLSAKYGKWERTSYQLQSFDKDANGSGSGTYRIHFEYNGHSGMIFCHYDKATGKFDRDEINANK